MGVNPANNRRLFLKKSILYGTLTGVAGIGLVTACGKEEGEEEVTPAEDLMREHGLLNRILLIYDTCIKHLVNRTDFPPEALFHSAQIIHDFIEDYHEKLEEDHLFPRFLKANTYVDLVQTLYIQHKMGREITERVIRYGSMKLPGDSSDRQQLASLLREFNTMYRPHESREDTVLFPAIRKIVSPNEYDALGEDFERIEHQTFGEDGFALMVDKVAGIEKQLDIYDLSLFTPRL